MHKRYCCSGVVASVLVLAACGGDGNGSLSSVDVVPVPTPTPTSTPAPSPSPTPAPAAAVEPYTLGTLTYTLAADIPADRAAAIRDAMDFAVAHTDTLGAFFGNIPVVFGAGTPTADASYLGQIRFGGSIGRRVALHELGHWLGSGSVGEWERLVAGGRFTGSLSTARIKAFDGPDAVVNADRAHFWPYGLNFDNEFQERQRNTQLISAQVVDMRLGGDATAAIAGVRRFQNRSSQFVLQGTGTGGAPVGSTNTTGTAQQWRVTFADGRALAEGCQTGLMIESAGMTGNNASAIMAPLSSVARQQWEMLPTGDNGWFLLRNRATGNCLNNIGNLAAGAALRLWTRGFLPNQQWRLIK